MTKYDNDPSAIPDDLAAEIGRVAIASSFTEGAVETALREIGGLDAFVGASITTHMNAPTRDNALRAIASVRIQSEEVRQELFLILDEVKRAFDKRNAIVHHAWVTERATGKVYRLQISARGKIVVREFPVTVEEVNQTAVSVHEAGLALYTFLGLNGFTKGLDIG